MILVISHPTNKKSPSPKIPGDKNQNHMDKYSPWAPHFWIGDRGYPRDLEILIPGLGIFWGF